MTAISLADRSRFVIRSGELLGELSIQLLALFAEGFLLKRKYRNFIRSDSGVEVHYHTAVATLERLFFIGVAENSEYHSFYAQRRLDYVWHVLFIGDRVGILEVLTADLSVRVEVEVRPVGDAPKFAPAEREFELKVRRSVGVV